LIVKWAKSEEDGRQKRCRFQKSLSSFTRPKCKQGFIEIQLSLAPFEVTRISREAAVARSCGRKPAERDKIESVSREAAAAIGREEIDVAASRLQIIICKSSVGLRPRLCAAIASRFRKCATSKLALRACVSELNTAEGLTKLT
jgi:hypothetical protein